MEWSIVAGRPVYLQLIEQLELAIVVGEYPPGEKIPGVRDLAAQAQVNPNTMQRALTELERTDIAIVTGDLDYAIAMQMAQGGMVKMTVLGNRSVKSVEIDKDALDPENADLLCETIAMAVNEAMEEIQKESDAIQEKITGQSGMPF